MYMYMYVNAHMAKCTIYMGTKHSTYSVHVPVVTLLISHTTHAHVRCEYMNVNTANVKWYTYCKYTFCTSVYTTFCIY